MKTAIDWSTRPPPWCWIGPAWAAEARAIAGRRPKGDPDEVPDQNGAALTGRRLKLKLTVQRLSELCGVSWPHLSQLEHGTGTASRETWAKIEAVLDRLEAEAERGR
jgi:hypothetical protein